MINRSMKSHTISIPHGVYDIDINSYHSSEGISRSAIMEFNKTPFHFWDKYINRNSKSKNEETSSMKIGSLIHEYVLEKKTFFDKYVISEKKDRRTKEGKQYFELIESNGKKVLDETEFEQIKIMDQSLMSNRQIHGLITQGKYEQSIYWTDPDTGLLCKCRPDIWQNNFIVDIKTSSNASYREFQRSMHMYGYHLQCAMISEAFKHVFNITMNDFIFVVIENKYPFAVAIYQFDIESLNKSIDIFKSKLKEIKKCYEDKEWPSYKTQIMYLPSYALGE